MKMIAVLIDGGHVRVLARQAGHQALFMTYPVARGPAPADACPFTFRDWTISPTSLDLGFSPNPCPRKPVALYDRVLLRYLTTPT